jgi:hypothetical protein
MERTPILLATWTASIVVCAAACGGDAKPAANSATHPTASASTASSATPDPADGPVTTIRTGALAPVDAPGTLEAKLVARSVANGVETLQAELAATPGRDEDAERLGSATIAVDGSTLVSLFAPSYSGTGRHLWLRRPASAAGTPVQGDAYLPASTDGQPPPAPGKHVRFRIADTTSGVSSSTALEGWLRALAWHLSQQSWRGTGAWQTYASTRLGLLAEAMKPKVIAKPSKTPKPPTRTHAQVVRPAPPPTSDDLGRLMETTTGATAVQEALQQERTLFVGAAKETKTVPLSSLTPPTLAHHPWKDMIAKLGGTVPAEPLAANAPADFYYARSKDLPTLFRLLDAIDQFGTPAALVTARESEDRALGARYEAELGLERSAMARALGGAVVGEAGIVGSDPYVKEGSDVTLLLRVKNRTLLDAALGATLSGYENTHGEIAHSTRNHAGVDVSVARSADGAVTQQRATVGDLELISNSPGAIDVVIDTSLGKHPKLADEMDYRFMLARDADTRRDVLVYMSDRFVGEVIGPKQKVLEARRQIALGDLMTPGFAALLYGWMYGKSPTSFDDLVAQNLLAKDDLTHASGETIAWTPGTAARSSFGTPAALTPLIDLPPPDRVTEMERLGYARFVRTYPYDWAGYIDPVALRVAFDDAGGHAKMTFDLRQLPLIDGTDYRELRTQTGDAHFIAGPSARGMRGIFALGDESWPRRELGDMLRTFSRHELKLDWLGDWGMVGVADRSILAEAALAIPDQDIPQLPDPKASSRQDDDDRFDLFARLPLYAEVGVKNMAGAAIALAGARVMAEETIPGMFDWGVAGDYRGVPVVRVRLKTKLFKTTDVSIYYAMCSDALIVTLEDWVIHQRIDDRLDGRGPASGAGKPTATQAMFDLSAAKGGGLWTALAWLTEGELVSAYHGYAMGEAEALLRGAPETAKDVAAERALAFAYFGATPLTPDGGAYSLGSAGLVDPARGSAYAPTWPSIPVAGSPLEALMARLAGIHSELSFDDEGKDGDKPMRSLHAKVSLDLR